MYILNQYSIEAHDTAAAAGAVNNVFPDVITGATGNSDVADSVTPIRLEEEFSRQIISKLVGIFIPAGGLGAENNYITVKLDQLGITGVRAVRAAALLGIYDSASVEQVGAGATPSFIGIWDKTDANVNSLCIVNDTLILRIPKAQIALFSDKRAMIQIWYRDTK